MKKEINKDSPFYAAISFNDTETEATVTLGTTEPKVCKLKLGVTLHVINYIEGLNKSLTEKQRKGADLTMFEEIKNFADTVSSFPYDNEEDIKLLQNNPIFKRKQQRVIITVYTGSASALGDTLSPMEDPMFETCPHCGQSGRFVDRKNPNRYSPTYYSKEDALAGLEFDIQKGKISKEHEQSLAVEIQISMLAPTTAEYLATQSHGESCNQN